MAKCEETYPKTIVSSSCLNQCNLLHMLQNASIGYFDTKASGQRSTGRENMNLLDLEKVGDLQLHGHCVLQDILVLLSSGLTIFLSGGAKLAHPPQKLALWALER